MLTDGMEQARRGDVEAVLRRVLPEDILSPWRPKGKCEWTPWALCVTALAWALAEEGTLGDRFSAGRNFAASWLGRHLPTSIQGFQKALLRGQDVLLTLVREHIQQGIVDLSGRTFRTSGGTAVAAVLRLVKTSHSAGRCNGDASPSLNCRGPVVRAEWTRRRSVLTMFPPPATGNWTRLALAATIANSRLDPAQHCRSGSGTRAPTYGRSVSSEGSARRKGSAIASTVGVIVCLTTADQALANFEDQLVALDDMKVSGKSAGEIATQEARIMVEFKNLVDGFTGGLGEEMTSVALLDHIYRRLIPALANP